MEQSGASRSARIAELLLRDARASNNTIADLLGLDRNLVSAVRHSLEGNRAIHRYLRRGGHSSVRGRHAEDCWCGGGSPPVHVETVRRRPWALITWEEPALTSRTRFFATRAQAVAAAPDDGPFTVIDISALRSRPHPPIHEILHERPPLEVVYSSKTKNFYGAY